MTWVVFDVRRAAKRGFGRKDMTKMREMNVGSTSTRRDDCTLISSNLLNMEILMVAPFFGPKNSFFSPPFLFSPTEKCKLPSQAALR